MNRQLDVLLFLIVLLIAVLIATQGGPDGFVAIKLGDVSPGEIGTTLLGFLLIALFIERAMEAYTAVWRQPERQVKAAEVQQAQVNVNLAASRLEHASEAAPRVLTKAAATSMKDLHAEKVEAVEEHGKAVTQIETYRAGTQVRTTIWSLFLGALIAVAGVRALDSFMDIPDNACEFPKYLFIGVDVALTAALLGGGADGIHKIISVFTTAADQKKAELEGRKPAQH
jgi:hypothetical protein